MYAVMTVGTDDELCRYDNGKDAGAEAGRRNGALREAGSEARVRVQRVEDATIDPDAWKDRESGRFNGIWKDDDAPYAILAGVRLENAKYTQPVWEFEAFYAYMRGEHFVHVSKDEPSKIAYTASAEHGRDDRQTRLSPGKYLARYFSDVLTDAEIQRYALLHATTHAPVGLLIARTANEIEHVFETGPNSCMSGGADEFNSRCHPARVYASDDLGVAYCLNKYGEVSARTVVWPDRMRHSTIYGDAERLGEALQTAGYSDGYLDGARLLKIDNGDGNVVLPYIDGSTAVEDHGDYLVVDDDGCIDACSTDGVGYVGGRYSCEQCGDRMDEDAMQYVNDEYLCDDCTQRCQNCGDSFNINLTMIDVDGDSWCEDCTMNDASGCGHCGEYTQECLVEIDGDDWYCTDCAENEAEQCRDCREYVTSDLTDGYCDDCEPDDDDDDDDRIPFARAASQDSTDPRQLRADLGLESCLYGPGRTCAVPGASTQQSNGFARMIDFDVNELCNSLTED